MVVVKEFVISMTDLISFLFTYYFLCFPGTNEEVLLAVFFLFFYFCNEKEVVVEVVILMCFNVYLMYLLFCF